jgi:hypothetical protein
VQHGVTKSVRTGPVMAARPIRCRPGGIGLTGRAIGMMGHIREEMRAPMARGISMG